MLINVLILSTIAVTRVLFMEISKLESHGFIEAQIKLCIKIW